MKKIQMVLLATLLISAGSFAQKGNNQIGAGSEVAFPTGDFGYYFKTGIGGYVKGLLGVGKAGQATITLGYTRFKEIESWEAWNSITSITPLMAGYRHRINGFFVEPQIGYGIIGAKTYDEGDFYTESTGIFVWSASAGYEFKNHLEISGRFQTGGKQGLNFGFFGVRLGYNFTLKGSK